MEEKKNKYDENIDYTLKEIQLINNQNKDFKLEKIKEKLHLLNFNLELFKSFYVYVIYSSQMMENGGHEFLLDICHKMGNLVKLYINEEFGYIKEIQELEKVIKKWPGLICPFANNVTFNFKNTNELELTFKNCSLNANVVSICKYSEVFLESFLVEQFPNCFFRVNHSTSPEGCKFVIKFEEADGFEAL